MGVCGQCRGCCRLLCACVGRMGFEPASFLASNAREAAVVEGVNVYPVQSLLEVRELLNSAAFGGMKATPLKVESAESAE